MNDDDIYAKTREGTEEIGLRTRKLPPRLRSMLIMVDGVLTVAQLRSAARSLGAPEGFLDELVALGLIAPRAPVLERAPLTGAPAEAAPSGFGTLPGLGVPPAGGSAAAAAAASGFGTPLDLDLAQPVQTELERFRAAQKFMNYEVVDALGVRSFFFTLKLEKCSNCDDLRALLPEFGKAITKGRGFDLARVLESRARSLLG